MSVTGSPEAVVCETGPVPHYETLQVELADAVATVYLQRPAKANAINATMWDELQQCFGWLDAEPGLRVVILAGRGKHFCAGIDLDMFADITVADGEPARISERLRRHILRLQGNLTAIETCRKPVLAAIHGSCIGGGVDMSCCCDMRYCTQDARFSIKEVAIGMAADVGTLQRLPRLIGDGAMRELAYTGRDMDAAEAMALGYVNRVYADHPTLLQGVGQIARQIAANSPLAVRGSKEMILYARDHSVRDGLNYVATWNAGMLSRADLMASVTAQLNKGAAVAYED